MHGDVFMYAHLFVREYYKHTQMCVMIIEKVNLQSASITRYQCHSVCISKTTVCHDCVSICNQDVGIRLCACACASAPQ